MKVQISKGGVIHLHEGSGVTLCGREYQDGKRMDHEDIKPSCQRCIKIEARKAEVEAAIVRNAQLVDELEGQLHPKPKVTEADDSGCEGHESLSGAHMGETVFCDGSCVQTVTHSVEADAQAGGAMLGRKGRALNCPYTAEAARLAFTHGWMTHHESCDCKISGGIGYTYDLATHTMIKNPPARQYTRTEMDLAWRRLGGFERGNGKHKGSKARRVRSHA